MQTVLELSHYETGGDRCLVLILEIIAYTPIFVRAPSSSLQAPCSTCNSSCTAATVHSQVLVTLWLVNSVKPMTATEAEHYMVH